MSRIANATTEPDGHEPIEITPEMIEADTAALAAYSPYFDLEADGVQRIYMAMVRAKPIASGGQLFLTRYTVTKEPNPVCTAATKKLTPSSPRPLRLAASTGSRIRRYS